MQASKFTTLVDLAAQLGVDGEVFALRLKSMFVDPTYEADPVSQKEIKFECLSCQLNYVISVAIEPEQKPSIEMLEDFPDDQMAEAYSSAKFESSKAQDEVENILLKSSEPIEPPPIQLITNLNPLQCTLCPYKGKTKNGLYVHKKTHKIYICHFCNATIEGKNRILNHFAFKHNKGIECPTCHAVFGQAGHLLAHQKTHSSVMHKCKLCPFETRHPRSLQTHQLQHSNKKPQHTCHICGKISTFRGNLVAHLRNVHNVALKKSEKRTTKHLRRDRNKPDEEDNHICNFCHKNFSTSQKLYSHKYLVHQHKDTKFLCIICGRGFAWQYMLTAHVEKDHQGKRYNCEYCEASLSCPVALRRHTNTFHTRETSYECDLCSKVYYCRIVMEDHMRIHTGERFKCPFCGRKFRARGVFYAHKRKKHPNMERKTEKNVE